MIFRKFKNGDTLIEVLFAVSAFSAVMVGGIALMNAGTNKTQATLQLTMARNAIDSQAEALRYINSVYIANYPNNSDRVSGLWSNIKNNRTVAKASSATDCPRNKTEISSRKGFVVDTINIGLQNNIEPASTFPRLIYNNEQDSNNITDLSSSRVFSSSEGLWVEAVKGSGYYDFHIRACWSAPDSNAPATIGTIVRLYDPAK